MCNPGASITDPMDSPNHTFHPLFIPFYPSIPSHCHLIPTFPPSIPFFPPSHLTFFFSLLFLSCSSLVKINSTICNAFSVILHCIYATTALYIGEKCFSGITFCPQLQRFLTRSLRQQVCLQTLLVQYVTAGAHKWKLYRSAQYTLFKFKDNTCPLTFQWNVQANATIEWIHVWLSLHCSRVGTCLESVLRRHWIHDEDYFETKTKNHHSGNRYSK